MNSSRRVCFRQGWLGFFVLSTLLVGFAPLWAEEVAKPPDKFSFLDVTKRLTGKIVDAEGRPVSGAKINAHLMAPSFESYVLVSRYQGQKIEIDNSTYARRIEKEHIRSTSDENGEFELQRAEIGYVLEVRGAGDQAGIRRVDIDEDEVTVQVGPTASAHGRLVDQQGQAVENATLRVTFSTYKGGDLGVPQGIIAAQAKTDAKGDFEFSNLVVGESYHLSVSYGENRPGVRLFPITAERASTLELGNVKGSQTPAEEVAEFYSKRDKLSDRISTALADCKELNLRLLIIVGDPQNSRCQALVAWRHENTAALNHYRQIAVSTADEAGMAELRELFGSELSQLKVPVWIVLNEDRKVVAHLDESSPNRFDRVPFLLEHRAPPLDAKKLLDDALAQARQDNKRVFVMESGTFCHPCGLLSRYFRRNSEILDPAFVFVRIDSSRYTRGDEVLGQLRPEQAKRGIPWYAILDGAGQVLGTSDTDDGRNIGYPSQARDVDLFIELLSAGAPQLTAEQLLHLRKDLTRGL